MDITFYCGITHKYWSCHLAEPGEYVCVSPIVGSGGKFVGNSVYVPRACCVLQDSGAYGDSLASGSSHRLSLIEALQRQERHAEKYEYADKIQYRASYDLLVDHRVTLGKIERVGESLGEEAVEATVRAAQFLAQHRNGVDLALNAQGVTAQQYYRCVQQIVPLLSDRDVLGLGGWCVIGRMRSMMSVFLETLSMVIPFLGREGVHRVHLYGCTYMPAVAACLAICDQYDVSLSIDSSFPAYAPRMGKWGYGSWRRLHYKRPPVLASCYTESCVAGTRCMGLECIRHVGLTREWLANFRVQESVEYQYYARNVEQYQNGQILSW